MKIDFQYFAQVRAAAGVEAEGLEVPAGADLTAALTAAAGRHGEDFRALVMAGEGQLAPGVLLLVNGRPAGGDLSRKLSDGDSVSLLSAVAGG